MKRTKKEPRSQDTVDVEVDVEGGQDKEEAGRRRDEAEQLTVRSTKSSQVEFSRGAENGLFYSILFYTRYSVLSRVFVIPS